MQKPSFWRVAVAYGIDFMVTFIMSLIVSVLWVLDTALSKSKYDIEYYIIIIPGVVLFVLNLLYFSIYEAFGGKTLGKKCLSLRVVNKQTSSPSLWRLLGAYGVDLVLLVPAEAMGLVIFLLGGFIVNALFFGGSENEEIWKIAIGGIIALVSAVVLYFSILESCFGKTLGKKLMGLQVVQNKPQAAQNAPQNQKGE